MSHSEKIKEYKDLQNRRHEDRQSCEDEHDDAGDPLLSAQDQEETLMHGCSL